MLQSAGADPPLWPVIAGLLAGTEEAASPLTAHVQIGGEQLQLATMKPTASAQQTGISPVGNSEDDNLDSFQAANCGSPHSIGHA